MTKIYIKKSERELELLKIINEKVEAGDIELPYEDNEPALFDLHELGICFNVQGIQEGEGDYYISATYYSEKLEKTIIWDYDFNVQFETPEEMAEVLAGTEEAIQAFENKLSIKK